MSGFFTTSFFALRTARAGGGRTSPGKRVMSTALVALAIDFFHYIPTFGARSGAWGIRIPESYFHYTSIFDLILEMLLGFGTVMVVMESVRDDVEEANRQLSVARDKLELIARIDPLTEALNRHAFYSLVRQNRNPTELAITGCVVIIDMDKLKSINDLFGHVTGDRAIRIVAHAVRSVIRADDMLFRWGGDEFLLLMFGIAEAEARKRMESLNMILAETHLQEKSTPVKISVSYGLKAITALTELERAIEDADEAMYQFKQMRKSHAPFG